MGAQAVEFEVLERDRGVGEAGEGGECYNQRACPNLQPQDRQPRVTES